jgi:hypothetical protein
VIFPPVPAFYNHPRTIDDIVDQTVMRVLDQFDIHLPSRDRWTGAMSTTGNPPKRALESESEKARESGRR